MAINVTLTQRLQGDMKASLKSGAKDRLRTLRLILAAVKQREIDERITLDDEKVIAVLDKMIKQRKESVKQFRSAGREDLVRVENFEIEVINDYLPAALSEEEIEELISAVVSETGASDIRQMGQVMGKLKPRVQGRADMSVVSAQVKQILTSQ